MLEKKDEKVSEKGNEERVEESQNETWIHLGVRYMWPQRAQFEEKNVRSDRVIFAASRFQRHCKEKLRMTGPNGDGI